MRNIYIYLAILITIVTGVSVIHAQTANVQTDGVVGWVKFDAGITSGVTCPDCGPHGGTESINGTCSATPSALASTGGSVVFTINPTDGTSPYMSTDSGWTTGNTITKTMTITPPYTYDVPIKDSSAIPKTGIATCNVGSIITGGAARMWVNNNPLLTTTKVRTGHSAKLNWSIVSDFINNGYDSCAGQGGSITGWTGSTITTDKPNYTPYLLPMPTPGSYTLKIKCSMSADPSQFQETNTVNVIVSDSIIEEI